MWITFFVGPETSNLALGASWVNRHSPKAKKGLRKQRDARYAASAAGALSGDANGPLVVAAAPRRPGRSTFSHYWRSR